MKRPDFLNIISNPFFLAAFFVLPFIIYFEYTQPKYQVEHIDKTIERDNIRYFYDDLDLDGRVELIRAKHNNVDEAAFVVEKDGKILDQYNLKKGIFPPFGHHLVIGDYNSDSIKEIYCITQFENELWLHVSDVFDTIEFRKVTIKVDTIWKIDGNYDYNCGLNSLVDMNLDGYRDLVFNVNAGFSIYPRRVYYYDIFNDSLHKSINYGTKAGITKITDIDDDRFPKILMSSTAVDNLQKYDSLIPFSDKYSWFMVFNHKLNFKYPPKIAGGKQTNFPENLK